MSSGAGRSRLGRSAGTAVLLGALALAVYILLNGSGPVDLFSPGDPTPTVAPPTDRGAWQVYFTTPRTVVDLNDLSGSIAETLLDHINAAQRSIHIAAFEFDLAPVAAALIAAHNRGVEVSWVTDDEYGIEVDEDEGAGLFDTLKDAGIQVRDDGRSALMHNKFWVFDQQTVWTGSTNATISGTFRNNNNVLVINSHRVAQIFEREFAEMWSGEFGPTSSSTVHTQRVTVDGTSFEILFAPEDEVASRLISLINAAQEGVHFMAFAFTHDEMGAAVLERARAGVDVQGIFESRGSQTEYSEFRAMYCAGVSVLRDGNPGMLHHKVFILDGETVITGSFNFTVSADESNDENVVIVTSRELASRYLQEFQRRWEEANAPDAAQMNCE